MQVNTNYVIVEKRDKKIVNFYSTKLSNSLAWAKECSRQMRSMSGKEYEVLVKIEDKQELIQLKDYENTLGREAN